MIGVLEFIDIMNWMDYSHIPETEIVASNDECAHMFSQLLRAPSSAFLQPEYVVLVVLLLGWCWHASVNFIYWPSESPHPLFTHKCTGHPRRVVMGTQQMSCHSFLAMPIIGSWLQFFLAQGASIEKDGMLAKWETSWELMLPVPSPSLSSFWGEKYVKGWRACPSQ